MKPLKYALYAAGGVLVLLVAAALVLTLVFDPNQFKPEIEKLARDATQRTLKLEGRLGLSFFPSLGVSLGKATLSEHRSEKQFASVESGRISVALLPLLRGEAVVDEIRIAGLRATIVRGRDGRLNIDDLLAAPPAAAGPRRGTRAPAAAAGAAPPLKFDISGVRIERASLGYRDERSRQELVVDGLDLRTGRIANDVPGSVRVSAAVRGKNPALDAKVEFAGDYRFNLERQTFSLSAVDAAVAGRAAGIEGLSATVKGGFTGDAAKGRFGASGVSVAVKGGLGKDTFEGSLSVPKLALEGDKASGESVNAELKLRGAERSADANVRIAGIEGSAKAVSVSSLKVGFDARAGDTALKGDMSTPAHATPGAGVYELPRITATITASSPALPQKTLTVPLSGSVRADLNKEAVAADLAAKLDESSVQLKLGLNGFASPRYAFDASIDRLDVDRYLPPKPRATGGGGAPGPAPQADTPVDLAVLKGLSVDGRLSIGALTVQRVRLESVRAPLRIANGKLEVSPHSARLYGGSVTGALALDSSGNRVALKESLQKVAAGPLVKDLLERDLIEGRGDIALDLTAAGATVNAMKKSMAGSARVSFVDGAVKGINLAESLRKAKAALGSKSAQQQRADKTQKTDFSEFRASFAVKGGVAHNEDLAVKSPFFRIGGAGDIDIGNSAIDYTVRASVVATAKGQGGVDLSDVAGVTVPVRIVGPFDALKFEVDYAAALREKAKGKLRERLERAKPSGGAGAGSLEDKAKEKLRKLFRR